MPTQKLVHWHFYLMLINHDSLSCFWNSFNQRNLGSMKSSTTEQVGLLNSSKYPSRIPGSFRIIYKRWRQRNILELRWWKNFKYFWTILMKILIWLIQLWIFSVSFIPFTLKMCRKIFFSLPNSFLVNFFNVFYHSQSHQYISAVVVHSFSCLFPLMPTNQQDDSLHFKERPKKLHFSVCFQRFKL